MPKLIVRKVTDDSYAQEKGLWEYTLDDQQSSSWFDTEEKAIDAYFSPYAWPGGYPLAFYDEAGVLCSDCAREEWLASEDGTALEAQAEDGDPSSNGLMCDNCNKWIVEPVCRECTDELSIARTPLFMSDDGESIICAKCIAQLCGKGEAKKDVILRYRITGPWYVGNGHPMFRALSPTQSNNYQTLGGAS